MNVTDLSALKTLRTEVRAELENNILPFWMTQMTDQQQGGFYGQITGEGLVNEQALKGGILNARILWFFSSAHQLLKKECYLEMATRAKRYLLTHFYDAEHGGIYWSVDNTGHPFDTKKQIYALGFAIYGLSEYYKATTDEEALEYAIKLFHSIEKQSFDTVKGGYLEAFTRDWQPIGDVRLSEKDENEKKTMNTHLHILEAYTNLYSVWKDKTLATRLGNLVDLFLEKIIDKRTGHLILFFNEDWKSKNKVISYGHDIEASWLLHEAARALNNPALIKKTEKVIPRIVAAATEGLQPDGSLIYEYNRTDRHYDEDRHWWVQAEAVLGYLNMFQYFEDREALSRSLCCWEYIKKRLVDPLQGEWYWSIKADGNPDTAHDKAGFWKCPYHNGRLCLSILQRVEVVNHF